MYGVKLPIRTPLATEDVGFYSPTRFYWMQATNPSVLAELPSQPHQKLLPRRILIGCLYHYTFVTLTKEPIVGDLLSNILFCAHGMLPSFVGLVELSNIQPCAVVHLPRHV
jgi:hypothetical protein